MRKIYCISILNHDDWIMNVITVMAWSRRGAARIVRKIYGDRIGIRSIEEA